MPRPLALPLVSLLLTAAAVAQDVGVSFTNGVNTYLEMPYDPAIVPQSGITVEAWVRYNDAIPTGTYRWPTIVRQNIAAGQESYFLRVNASNTAARTMRWKVVTVGGTNVVVDWNFAAGQLATWTHFAGTYDGSTAQLFVNGVLVGSAAGNGQPIRDLGGVLRIGKGDDAIAPYEVWNGEIDEVRVWPFARTQSDIQTSMNQTLYVIPGLVETWNLDYTLVDSSSGITMNAVGVVPFVANTRTPTLPVPPAAVGASTPGCLGPLWLSPGNVPIANTTFTANCYRTPANAVAIWVVTLGVLPFGFPILGVDLWVDPTVNVLLIGVANGLGTLPFAFPLGATEPPGFTFALQALVLDPCGSQGFTASNALAMLTQ